MTADTASKAMRAASVDRTWFQRMQALEDAVAYRTARLAVPCPGCGPSSALCDDHATDHGLITGYRIQRHKLASLADCVIGSIPAPQTKEDTA